MNIPVPTRAACLSGAWVLFLWFASALQPRVRIALLVCPPLALLAYWRWVAEPLEQRQQQARELQAFFSDGPSCARALLEVARREKDQQHGVT